MEELQAEIASITPYQLKEIKAAFEDAGVRALEYDDAVYSAAGLSPTPLKQSPYLVRLMQRNYEATAGTWKNLTRTHAEAAQQLFIKECDAAYNLVSTGAVSYTEAFRDAINTIAHDGVKITYPSGHEDTIETATLRCVRTGVSQATADITDARMDEMDWDIVLVSSHLGARVTDKDDFTNHAWWQGKFYSRSGKDKRFQPFEVCGRGHVQGINGANCRHSYGPGDGEHNPYEQYDSEENRKAYELSQRQRLLERRIRATKREVMGLQAAAENAPESMKADLVAPNSAVLLMDSDATRFYMKSADASGIPSLRIFEYNEVLPSGNQPVSAAKENDRYVTREEHQRQYDELSQKIDRMLADIPKKPQRKASGGGEDE